jgi:hypothetical protein
MVFRDEISFESFRPADPKSIPSVIRRLRDENLHHCSLVDVGADDFIQTDVSSLTCTGLSIEAEPLSERLGRKADILDHPIDREGVDSGSCR